SAGVDCERRSDSARWSSQQSLALLPSASAINVCKVLRRSSTGPKCTMRADFLMPLPKSVLCAACKKTYPEGWKRCPYCGHDPLRHRQESGSRKFMQKKVQEFEQKFSRERKPPRPETRGQE